MAAQVAVAASVFRLRRDLRILLAREQGESWDEIAPREGLSHRQAHRAMLAAISSLAVVDEYRATRSDAGDAIVEHGSRAGAKEQRRRRKAIVKRDGGLDRLVVLERDDGICGICGHDVDPLDFHIDHIVPICRGGAHSYANTQLAHPLCNNRKRAVVVLPGERISLSGPLRILG